MLTLAHLSRKAVLICLVMASLLFIRTAQAQTDTELRSSADYAYGQVMRFRLHASNLGELDRVTLFFRPHTSAESFAVEIPVEPGNEVDVTYALDLTQTQLPPFSSVEYWWELERPDGATFRVPERSISYVDDQFSWQWLTKADPEGGGVVTIQWTGDNPGVGETTFDIVLDALDRVSPFIPLDEVQPFNVFIYPSSADLASAMRLAGQEWTVGQSYPELGVLLVTAVNPATAQGELTEGISQELTNLLLYQALPDGYQAVPQWVRSGLIEIAAGGTDARSAELLAGAVAAGTTPSLADLCTSYPTDEAEATLAQAQSGEILTFIADQFGTEAVVGLVKSFAGGADCDTAFQTVLQSSTVQVERGWRQQVKLADSQRTRVSQAIIWVLFILAGFGLAALIVRRVRSD